MEDWIKVVTPMWQFGRMRGSFLGGSHNKDHNVLFGLESLYFGKLPENLQQREVYNFFKYQAGSALLSVVSLTEEFGKAD